MKDIARPYLKSLADSIQETVKLSVLSGMQAFTLISIEGSRPIRINIDTGALFPLNAGADEFALIIRDRVLHAEQG